MIVAYRDGLDKLALVWVRESLLVSNASRANSSSRSIRSCGGMGWSNGKG